MAKSSPVLPLSFEVGSQIVVVTGHLIIWVPTALRPLCYLTLSNVHQTISLINGEPLGGKGLTGPICPSSSLTFPLGKPTKTVPFVIWLCLTPDDFTRQRRALGWERFKGNIQILVCISFDTPRKYMNCRKYMVIWIVVEKALAMHRRHLHTVMQLQYQYTGWKLTDSLFNQEDSPLDMNNTPDHYFCHHDSQGIVTIFE